MNIVENGEVAVTVLVSQLSCFMVMGKLELFVHVVPAHGGDRHIIWTCHQLSWLHF